MAGTLRRSGSPSFSAHTPAALYATVPSDGAKRLVDANDCRHMTKRCSRLHMAEIEQSALSRESLIRRMLDLAPLEAEVATWE